MRADSGEVVLRAVQRRPEQSVGALEAALNLAPSTIRRALRRLEATGAVTSRVARLRGAVGSFRLWRATS